VKVTVGRIRKRPQIKNLQGPLPQNLIIAVDIKEEIILEIENIESEANQTARKKKHLEIITVKMNIEVIIIAEMILDVEILVLKINENILKNLIELILNETIQKELIGSVTVSDTMNELLIVMEWIMDFRIEEILEVRVVILIVDKLVVVFNNNNLLKYNNFK